MNLRKSINHIMILVFTALSVVVSGRTQGLDGSITGQVRDSATGQGVPNVTVTAKNSSAGSIQSVETNSLGFYVLAHLWIGSYTLETELSGYQKSVSSLQPVNADQTVQVNFIIQKGESKTAPSLTAPLYSGQLETGIFNVIGSDTLKALPVFGRLGSGSPDSLSVYMPGVVTQSSGIVGAGGSIAGLRPSANYFFLDGADNEQLDLAGPLLPVIPESVAEFSVQPNPAGDSNGYSGGGLFNLVTKSGSSEVHGSLFGIGGNRKLNAFDPQEKQDYADGLINGKRRYDYFRGGGTIGGPVLKDRLFGFAAYQYESLGQEAVSFRGQSVTNEGLQTIEDEIKGLSSNNVAIIKNQSIWPTALVPNGNYANVTGSDGVTHQVELGDLVGSSSQYVTRRDWLTNLDYLSESQQIHGRFQYSNHDEPSFNPAFAHPLFEGDSTLNQWRLNLTQIQPVKPQFIRETRLVFRRLDEKWDPAESFVSTPNYSISSLALFMGPDTNTPQSRKVNVFQLVNNFTWLKGKHNYRFGVDYRRWNAPTSSLPNSRGSYDWKSLQSFLKDEIPTGSFGAYRGVGTTTFTDERDGVFAFFQDEFKLLPLLSLTWGVRYQFIGIPSDAALQKENEVSSIPGLLDFREPRSDKNNLAPRLGFAYDLFGQGTTTIRGGVGMNYDTVAGDYFRLSLPPQFQQVMTPALACSELDSYPNYCRNNSPVGPPNARGFLVSGALPSTEIPPETVKKARAATQRFIPDMVSPTVYSWNLGVEHEFRRNWILQANYIGSRAQHLLVENNRNQGIVIPGGTRLPTYFNSSDVPSNASGAPSLADVLSYSGSGQRILGSYGFSNDIISYDPMGSSSYHGGSLYVQNRGFRGFFFRGGYTYGRARDNSSEALYGGAAGPTRAQDVTNLDDEMAVSSLNRKHHFSLSWTYELPRISSLPSLVQKALGGWQVNGIALVESGQPFTPLSGYDINNNLDTTSDRLAVNPNGDAQLGTDTNYVIREPDSGQTSISSVAPSDLSRIVGYVAVNPNAMWVATRLGGQTSSSRNALTLSGISNWNLGISKSFMAGENKKLQFRVDLFNAFNHPQYTLSLNPKYTGGSLTQQQDYLKSLYTNYATATSAGFLSSSALTSTGRILQVGVKFTF